MTVQVIKQGDKPDYAIIPYKLYLQLVEKAEMLQDIQDYDSIKSAIERGNEELISSEVVYAILDGEDTLKVWREYRGMSQKELAQKSGIVSHTCLR